MKITCQQKDTFIKTCSCVGHGYSTNSTSESTACASHVELLNTTGDDRKQWPCNSWSIQEEGRQGSSYVRALFSVGSTRRPATDLCAHVFGSSSQRRKTSRLHGSNDRSLLMCSWRDDLRETRSWAARDAVFGNRPDASLADDARLSFLDKKAIIGSVAIDGLGSSNTGKNLGTAQTETLRIEDQVQLWLSKMTRRISEPESSQKIIIWTQSLRISTETTIRLSVIEDK